MGSVPRARRILLATYATSSNLFQRIPLTPRRNVNGWNLNSLGSHTVKLGSLEQNRGGDDHGEMMMMALAVAVSSVVYGGLSGGAQHIL